MPEDAFHSRVADEIVHQRLIRAGGQQVEIAAGVAAAPQAADRRDRRLRRTLAQIADERGRGIVRIRQEMPPGVALALLERLQDERLLFPAHAAQRADASIGRRALEVVERPDPELAVQRGHGLGADALQVEQIQNGRRKLGEELAMKGRAAGFGDLADSGGQILPDARNLAQPRFVERRELVRMVRGDVGAVAIRADLEGVVALDLQEIGNLAENARDAPGYPSWRPSVSMR